MTESAEEKLQTRIDTYAADIKRYEDEDDKLASTLDERHPLRLQLARRIHSATAAREHLIGKLEGS